MLCGGGRASPPTGKSLNGILLKVVISQESIMAKEMGLFLLIHIPLPALLSLSCSSDNKEAQSVRGTPRCLAEDLKLSKPDKSWKPQTGPGEALFEPLKGL